MFYYFTRGSSLYWSQNKELLKERHTAALKEVVTGKLIPEPVTSVEKHPHNLFFGECFEVQKPCHLAE